MAERAAAVKNLIVQAQKQDASGDEQGAYRHYLLCVQAISQLLQSSSPGSQGELPPQKAKQLYQMAKHCLDRSESISESIRAAQAEEAQRQRAMLSCTAPVPAPRGRLVTTSLSSTVLANPTQPAVAAQLSVPRGSVQRQQQVSKQVSQPSHLHHLSPTQAAALKNRLLMEQYQAHIRGTASSAKVSPSFRGLEHLRRLDENMSVARIQERADAQKQKLNEMRAQHSSKSPVVRHDTLSLPELCALVTKYNQEHGKYLNAPTSHHHDSQKVYNFVTEVLSSSDHPLARLMGECQYNVFAILKPVVVAVRSLNGLPYIEIKLAEKCHTERSQSQAGTIAGHSSVYSPEEDGDAHMDLLCSEEDLSAVVGSPDPVVGSPDPPLDHGTVAETQPMDQVTPTETPPTQDDGQDLNDKLSRLRKALLGDSGSVEEEGGTAANWRNEETIKRTSEGRVGVSQPSLSAEGSYCLQGPEAISTGTESAENKAIRTPVASPASVGAHTGVTTTACGHDSIPRGPKSVHPLPDGLDSIPPVPGSTLPTPSIPHALNSLHGPDATPGSPDSTPGGPDSIPGGPAHVVEKTHDGNDWSDSSRGGPPVVTSPQSAAETLGQYAMVGPEAKGGGGASSEAIHGSRPGEEEEAIFRSLPPLVCTLHADREREMAELEKQYRDVLKAVFKQIHASLDKLEAGFTQAYPWVGTEENSEYCQAVVEANFFPVIMPYLQTAFRCIKYSDEMAVARSMCQHVNATPKDLSVRKKFWLLEQAHAPFGEAIEEVRQIPQALYLSPKLGTLVKMSKAIVECIEAYHRVQGTQHVDLSVGVDDMLPIMTYIILRSAKPDLVSECALMEEFIQEGYMKGEEGFCLTSFRTALLFIAQMSS